MQKSFATTLDPGSSLTNHTGSWRTERPVFVHRLPPCNNACRAGENIQQWLYHAEAGFLSASSENMALHVDMAARKAAAFPQAILTRVERMKAAHAGLPVPQGVGRRIAMRRN